MSSVYQALFNDIPRVGNLNDSTFTTYPGRDVLLRHTRVGAQFNDIPGMSSIMRMTEDGQCHVYVCAM